MNTRRAARVAGAGFAATGVFLAALVVLGAAIFLGFDVSSGAGLALISGPVVVLIVAGGALPARALGAGWAYSLAVSGIAVGLLALATPYLSSSFSGLFALFFLFALAAPAFVAVAAAAANGLSFAGLASVIAVVAAAFVAIRYVGFVLLPGVAEASFALIEGTVIVATGWALLPALVALFQRRPHETPREEAERDGTADR